MSPQLTVAQARFFAAYESVKVDLGALRRGQLMDLRHEAEEIKSRPTSPFSERAAAELIHAAAAELLEEMPERKHYDRPQQPGRRNA